MPASSRWPPKPGSAVAVHPILARKRSSERMAMAFMRRVETIADISQAACAVVCARVEYRRAGRRGRKRPFLDFIVVWWAGEGSGRRAVGGVGVVDPGA